MISLKQSESKRTKQLIVTQLLKINVPWTNKKPEIKQSLRSQTSSKLHTWNISPNWIQLSELCSLLKRNVSAKAQNRLWNYTVWTHSPHWARSNTCVRCWIVSLKSLNHLSQCLSEFETNCYSKQIQIDIFTCTKNKTINKFRTFYMLMKNCWINTLWNP